jgi:predicted Zn finger-like uncharacterized protein
MFTRCPQCTTVFRVTANQLRAARGDVRCGNCAHVFNAMESLADELPGDDARPGPETATPPTPEDGQNRADSLEFDAPEQAWSEIFIAEPSRPGDVSLDGDLETITADPDEWRAMLAELGVEPVDPTASDEPEPGIDLAATSLGAEAPALDDPDDEAGLPDAWAGGAEQPVYVIDDATETDAREPSLAGETGVLAARTAAPPAPEAADQVDQPGDTPVRDAPAGIEIDEEGLPPWDEPAPAAPAVRARSGRLTWATAALLVVALVAQLGHYARDRLATHPRYGALVRDAYAGLGVKLYPEWPLDAFYIRRSEALAGGSAPDALDISAAVEVTGGQPVGLPLVRVTLRDQWANTVGSRLFVPEEYLADELPGIVTPGTRIPVALSLADPGPAARGYEMDLCLQRRQRGLECQLAERPYRP